MRQKIIIPMADILHFPSQHQRRAVVEKYTGGFMQSMYEMVNKLSCSTVEGHGKAESADTSVAGFRPISEKCSGQNAASEYRASPTGIHASEAERATDVEPENIQAASTSYATTSASLRCEMWRSPGWDVTRENSLLCNAPTARVCLHCGPICGECASEYACCSLTSEHEF